MRVSGLFTHFSGRSHRAPVPLTLLVLGASALCASPAAAWNTPGYSISIVEGVTTLPEHSILSTSASVQPSASATLQIIHEGVVVAQDTGEGGAWLSQVPQVGDTVKLESPSGSGQIVGSVVYDGLPSMDPTVCAGSINFSGQRTPGTEVEGSYFTLVPHSDYVAQHLGGVTQITSLTGSSFAGNFLAPLAVGETVSAREHERKALAGGLTFTYESETQRPVGACPVPPAPPAPPPPLALLGTILKLVHVTIVELLRSGWTDQVTINQPGTVVQDLYLQDGDVPANASSTKGSHKRHKRKPPALLLARGSALAKSAGTVRVSLKLTAQGRRRLSHSHSAKVVLVTTLRASSGAKLDLERRSITLRR
jgi:hypothetical protein